MKLDRIGWNGNLRGGVRYRALDGAENNGIRDACSTADITMQWLYLAVQCTVYMFVRGCAWLYLGLPWSVSDQHRVVLIAQTYNF